MSPSSVWLSLLLLGAAPRPLSGPATTPTTWTCTIRCYEVDPADRRQWRWLDELNQSVLVCTDLPNDIQKHIDRYCADDYAPRVRSGWVGRGELNWPASPGRLSACRAAGHKCATRGVLRAIWQCPADCRRGTQTYPTQFTMCAANAQEAFDGGLAFYKRGGPHALCEPGYELVDPDYPLDPAVRQCRSTEKECEIAP